MKTKQTERKYKSYLCYIVAGLEAEDRSNGIGPMGRCLRLSSRASKATLGFSAGGITLLEGSGRLSLMLCCCLLELSDALAVGSEWKKLMLSLP